jgi:hypothetical protein
MTSQIQEWRITGSYFEGCNCEAICPCRSIRGVPGGASTFGECFGALSWHIYHGHAGDIDLSGLRAVMSIRYVDRVQPSTPWQVVLYVDDRADEEQSGLPPSDRTPVYAACWRCQNSSNSLGDM